MVGAVFALIVSACAQGVGVQPPSDYTPPTIDPDIISIRNDRLTASTTTTAARAAACGAPIRAVAASNGTRSIERLDSDGVEVAIAISEGTFECTAELVVAPADDIDRIAIGARLAVALGAPLLLGGSSSLAALDDEITRLGPSRVFLIGEGLQVAIPGFAELRQFAGSTTDIADEINTLLAVDESVSLPLEPGSDTVVAAVDAMISGRGLTAPTRSGSTPSTTTPSGGAVGSTGSTGATATTTTTTIPVADETAIDVVPVAYVGTGATGEIWLTAADDAELSFPAIAAAAASGGLAALVDGRDLRAIPEIGRAIQGSSGGASEVHLVGDMTADAEWQVTTLADASELPGGGFLLFPRRFVALYGHPGAAVLGVLGEQGPRESVTLAKQIAPAYGADGVPAQPAFEIIATIASSAAGADGDYSDESTVDYLRPWVEIAAAEGVYVILDLQPGRTDFLTQAKRYEELLLQPHVGLALDPEWRLKPDERHLRQIGSVQAAEVNTVVDWLAALVRDNGLPQKMLLLHQFRMSMLQDRDDIRTPAELATVIQMDGQGALNVKYGTWGVITEGWEDFGWQYGWKNFYDEDIPTPTPEIVLDLVPVPVLVSYQ